MKYNGGLDWEIHYSKCYGKVADMCADELITEEEAEALWDKFQEMSLPQLKRWLNRWQKTKRIC